MKTRSARAAQFLLDAHRERKRFAAFPAALAPRSLAEAYAVQDVFVALKSRDCGGIAGYKIALTTEAMRRMVRLDDSIAGTLLARQVVRAPASVRAADYGRLIVEFEVALELAADLPAADAPYTRERVAAAVGAAMPAFELADDRNADYADLAQCAFELVAENAWNEGAVLGKPLRDWRKIDLAAVRGIATINGAQVGEGKGADVMGHPVQALAWVANHLAGRGKHLSRGDVVITGSLVTSKFPKPGDALRFELGQLGTVELRVE